MPIVDRMEFPRRYKLKESVLLLVIVAILAGIWIQRSGQQRLRKQIVISDVQFNGYTQQYIELGYTITNTGRKEREIQLLARVWAADGEELASALFAIPLLPESTVKRSKLLDRLNRSLKEGEKPYRAEVSLYERGIP